MNDDTDSHDDGHRTDSTSDEHRARPSTDRTGGLGRRTLFKSGAAAVGASIVGDATAIAASSTVAVERGVYALEAVHSGKVLDVEGGLARSETDVLQYDYWGGPNQHWELDPLGDGTYRLIAQHSGQVLAPEGGRSETLASLVQQEWTDAAHQRWRLEALDDGTYALKHAASGLVADVSDGETGNAVDVVLRDWHRGDNQRWALRSVGAVPRGVYELEAAHSGKVLDVSGVSEDPGASVHQWADWDDPGNQQWAIEPLADGEYRLVASHSDLVLAPIAGLRDWGASLVQQEWTDAAHQRWTLEELDDGSYRITNVENGQVADVYGAGTDDGDDVIQYGWHGGDNQRWRLHRQDDDPEPPEAAFDASPTDPAVGDSVQFDASASSDPDGSIASYEWAFGDGATASGETASHAYSSAGDYAVELTVTDGDGLTDTTTGTVSVEEEAEFVARDSFYDLDDPSVNRATSKHFQIVWGSEGHERVDDAFVRGNLENFEKIYDTFVTELGMLDASRPIDGDRDGTRYKTNVYVTETGLSEHESGWAFMGAADGFGFVVLHPDAMRVDPPSWTTAHEFGHVLTAHQNGGWNDNALAGPWWESMAEFFAEQFITSDNYAHGGTHYGPDTGFYGPLVEQSHLFQAHGRDYYDVWPLWQFLEENPDGLDGYGPGFVQRALADTTSDQSVYDMIDALAPADLRDTLGHWAKRMATGDLEYRDLYREEIAKLRDSRPKAYRAFTELEPVPDRDGWWRVPFEHAPMQGGFTIAELEPTDGTVSVDFEGVGGRPDAEWRAALVAKEPDGTTRYSDLIASGTASVDASGAEACYLTVAATPATMHDVSAFETEDEAPYDGHPAKAQLPYEVRFSGARPVRTTSDPPGVGGSRHPNGGGFVADSASVADSAFVGPNACVLGSATVEADAQVRDYAVVRDDATVTDRARVIEHGVVKGGAVVRDRGIVKGTASVFGEGVLEGTAVVDGDYAGDLALDSGTVFGWLPEESVATGRPAHPDVHTEYAFEADGHGLALDTYGVNHGIGRGDPDVSGGTLSMTPDQYVVVPDHVLDYERRTVEVEIRPDDAGPSRIWSLGADRDDRISLGQARDGTLECVVVDGGAVTRVETDRTLPVGTWTTVRAEIGPGGVSLVVDGDVVASEPAGGVAPVDLRSSDPMERPHRNYLGRGLLDSLPGFAGSVGRFTVGR